KPIQRIVVRIACAGRGNTVHERNIHAASGRDARRLRRIVEIRIEVYEAAAAALSAGIGRLTEERMANAVCDRKVRFDAPCILTVVFKLIVEDVCGDIERSLGKRTHLAKEEIREGLFEIEWTSGQSTGAADRRVGCGRGDVGRIENIRSIVGTAQLILVFVVVIKDCTEFQCVLAKYFCYVAVRRVVGIVVAVRTKSADSGSASVGKDPAGQGKSGYSSYDVVKWQ